MSQDTCCVLHVLLSRLHCTVPFLDSVRPPNGHTINSAKGLGAKGRISAGIMHDTRQGCRSSVVFLNFLSMASVSAWRCRHPPYEAVRGWRSAKSELSHFGFARVVGDDPRDSVHEHDLRSYGCSIDCTTRECMYDTDMLRECLVELHPAPLPTYPCNPSRLITESRDSKSGARHAQPPSYARVSTLKLIVLAHTY